ncbi:MAG TPA: hypothetical protein EYP49_19790 [Anaerolineae bacterium]|nr:hypothetical protein [Anaerolineae bacterium]
MLLLSFELYLVEAQPLYKVGGPSNEYICEETGEEVILMKDQMGRVIGFEKLNSRYLSRNNYGWHLRP